MSEPRTKLGWWLRGAQTRRMFARALGGGERPNNTYLSMATRALDAVATEINEKPWTDFTAAEPNPSPDAATEPSTEAGRLRNIRDAVDAARPGDLQALRSFEDDFRWLLLLAEARAARLNQDGSASSVPPALDVERLHEAMRRAYIVDGMTAESIAAAYAAETPEPRQTMSRPDDGMGLGLMLVGGGIAFACLVTLLAVLFGVKGLFALLLFVLIYIIVWSLIHLQSKN